MERRDEKTALRARIIGMTESGKSVRNIARDLGISKSTVSQWIRRWQETGCLTDNPKGRPPRKTTAEEDNSVIQAAERNSHSNAVAIRQELGLQITAKTVRLRLHEAGIHHRVPSKKEHLTERHRQNRLLFAQNYVNRDQDFWARVIFTDEKNVLLYESRTSSLLEKK